GPINVRGPSGTIGTNVSGIQISELLPLTAQHMDKCTILRSMTSTNGDHSGVTMMSGASSAAASYGAVLAKLKGPAPGGMPAFVHVGPKGYVPGAGKLESGYGPIVVADPSGKQMELPDFG